ncbi:MAG: thioredoxin domain-containing protein [Janthinobacterium lividum]
MGFAYFAGTWLALLVLGGSPGGRLVLAALPLLSLPFTLYSLYYQARVARQWCRLCCAVLAVLWVEFGASAAYLTPLRLPSLAEWAMLLGCLLAPVLAWVFGKPYLAQAQQAATLRQQLLAFKRNKPLFDSALAAQPRYELLPPADAIQLGNPEARHVLTVVSSPTCPPCTRTHALLEQWLTRRDDVQVQIVFAVPDNPHDARTQVAAHLLVLYQQHPATAREALHTWYVEAHQKYGPWASRYPAAAEALAATSLPKHYAWCERAAVSATPTVFLNGQALPDLYRLEDIQYFL